MARVTLDQVRSRCVEGRFYAYDNWRDRLFVPPSIVLVWIFLRLGWSGNGVSFLSGALAVAGGFLMTSNDMRVLVVGSFGYMAFYLLDYVDGGVARFRGGTGIGGQYIDWVMHAVSAVGIAAGLFAGALNVAGSWVIPFGMLTVIAATLALDRYSLAWFAICMHYQQQRVRQTLEEPPKKELNVYRHAVPYRVVRRFALTIFHEDYAIFTIPLLAILQLMVPSAPVDFRVLLIVAGGVIYFPVVIYDIWHLAAKGRVDYAYKKLFLTDQVPKLPGDHFFY